MSELSLTRTRIQAGRWEGVLCAPSAPELLVTCDDAEIAQVSLAPHGEAENTWTVQIAIPAELLSDGVQTFVISDKATGKRLDSFAIVTGQPLEDDIRAEVDLLRAELDMLKRAFRRHCAETVA